MEDDQADRTQRLEPFKAQELAVEHLIMNRGKPIPWVKILILTIITFGFILMGWLILR